MAVINVKGTHDIIGEESNAFAYIENLLKQICDLFAYNEVRPPVIEHSELFVRGSVKVVILCVRKCTPSLIKANVPSHYVQNLPLVSCA